MTKKMRVTITSAMGESEYKLDPAQLLRLTEFATNLQMEHGEPMARPAQSAEAEEAPIRIQKNVRRSLDEGPYAGFLLIKCENCGDLAGFNARRPTFGSKCKKCGTETPLEKLRMAHLACSCGKVYSYKTNVQDKELEHACLSCGKPIRAKLNWNGTAYIPEKKGSEKE